MNRATKMQLLAALASLVLWALPGAGMILLPLELLNTHIHELCHAVVAVATGGDVSYIKVFSTGSGVTPISGGSPILAASAGYVGATVLGGLILLFSRTDKGARNALFATAGALTLSMLFWVRGDIAGVASGLLWILLLFGMGKGLKGDALVFAAQFIGTQQCLRSVQSLYVLLHINATSNLHNDAKVAEMVSGIPSLVWALGWCLISAAWMAVALAPSFRQSRGSGRSSG